MERRAGQMWKVEASKWLGVLDCVCLSSVCCGFLSSSLLCSKHRIGLAEEFSGLSRSPAIKQTTWGIRSLSSNCQNSPISTITEGFRWVSDYTPRSLYIVDFDGKLPNLQFFILQWIITGTVNNNAKHVFRNCWTVFKVQYIRFWWRWLVISTKYKVEACCIPTAQQCLPDQHTEAVSKQWHLVAQAWKHIRISLYTLHGPIQIKCPLLKHTC